MRQIEHELYETETMAELCARQGRLQEAVAIYRRLLDTHGGSEQHVSRWNHRLTDLEQAWGHAAGEEIEPDPIPLPRAPGVHVTAHDPGDIVSVGAIDVELVHTPGHTPGSQCFLVDGRLVSGDTLFLDGCGRTDLPGSDPSAMADSLKRLSKIADDVILYPGHRYSIASSALMGSVKASNWAFSELSA
jgi:glyoxylase-like metal-dependent hydrolase (beta-lactamase superfamily II)